MDEEKVNLRMRLGEVFFRGIIRSIISHKSYVTLTVHVAPSKFLVSRLYDLVGETGLVLGISRSRGEGDANGKGKAPTHRPGSFLSREDYVSLRDRVSEDLKLLSGLIGKDVPTIIYEETTFTGKDRVKREGRRTLNGMRGTQLKYLAKRLDVLVEKARKGTPEKAVI